MIPPFFRLIRLDETTSTNDDARCAGEAGEAEGLVIQALRQSAGKGRQGRKWTSSQGNLYVSVLLRPSCSPQEASLYSFVAALAVYDTVADVLGAEKRSSIHLKWPNDVLVEGKKISGILLEASPVKEGKIDWLVIGTGINVVSCPENTPYPVTCLASQAAEISELDAILEKYLENLNIWRLTLSENGFESLGEIWASRARKGTITARMGRETVVGEFDGLDAMGHLLLKLENGSSRAISAADIFFS